MCTPCVVLFLRTESLQSRPKTASTVATRRILTYTYVSRCAYNPDLPALPFGNLAYLNVLLLLQVPETLHGTAAGQIAVSAAGKGRTAGECTFLAVCPEVLSMCVVF